MQNKPSPKKSKVEVDVGSPAVDLTKRVIDLTAADLVEIVDARLALFLEGGAPKSENDDSLLDRAGAAKYLSVSVSQLDKLIREHGIPHHVVGDTRRFERGELRDWALRQKERE